ncbi:hypothetical protein O3W44_01490 [Pantoea sp. LMR881]|uniref:hypothetical protein n=1 Tax=Pantoea sp. LMR881 TaxID=3014336 RepID=UPI0022AE62C2|nr:hypothetical protein [Pantoea sp. LMR881]MCZ4057800.1 hypothetical protein [Pantoea sp. LMR881]MCZ4058042.1 hypothetical protein [Pantoea sp. LMR881]
MSNSYDWERRLDKDDSLYFYPLTIEVKGNFKIRCDLSGSYELTISDVIYQGKQMVMLEHILADDDDPVSVAFIETDSSIESMIHFIKSTDAVFHEPLHITIHEWALQCFYRS